MKKEDWLWVLGGLTVFLLMKNASQPAAPAATASAGASVELPAMMVSTGLFGGGTAIATGGLAGVPKPSDRGRNFGTAHRSRYKYPT